MQLTIEGELDEDGKKQLREAFMHRHSGSGRAWMPLLLEGGLKASRIGLTAPGSQYLEVGNSGKLPMLPASSAFPMYCSEFHRASPPLTRVPSNFSCPMSSTPCSPWCRRIEQTIHRDLSGTVQAAELLRPARYRLPHPRRPTNALFRSRGRNQRGIPHTERSADDGESAHAARPGHTAESAKHGTGRRGIASGIRRGSNTVGSSARLEHRRHTKPSCLLMARMPHRDVYGQIVARLSQRARRDDGGAMCGVLPRPVRPAR